MIGSFRGTFYATFMKQHATLNRFSIIFLMLIFCPALQGLYAQTTVEGTLTDAANGDPIVGATVGITDGSAGAYTDDDGKFSFKTPKAPPFDIRIVYAGYEELSVTITEPNQVLDLKMEPSSLAEVEIVASASQERQKQSPLTLESMSSIAITETPSADFYEGLGHLKGVDLNSASIGFKVVNTRGFNGPTPVRSLQVIDGVDNQSPGLNFSLGNFLGASELDIESVDLVVGASSAFYGPNAFNGVISMKTKSPFLHEGLTVQLKAGERNQLEGGMRFAKAFRNSKGQDKFAFKLNAYYLSVDDWEADNLNPVDDSDVGANNPGGYDAVNRYGDEFFSDGNSPEDRATFPGLGNVHRTGYMERDVLDYDTRNYKVSAAAHYMLTPKIEAIGAFNTAGGDLVMQTLNRIRLKNISFYQARLEVRQRNKFFLRAYRTWEDAGDSYDAYFAADLIQQRTTDNSDWRNAYRNEWQRSYFTRVRGLEGFPPRQIGEPFPFDAVENFLNQPSIQDSLQLWHAQTRAFADQNGIPRAEPGTAAFDSLLNLIATTPLNQGGALLRDRSALWHGHGEYRFEIPKVLNEVVVGANFRQYRPQTFGSIFADTIQRDSTFRQILNSEWGAYIGIEKKLFDDRLRLNATARVDKNQNFNAVPTFLLSGVYNVSSELTVRASISSAIRNPTLADQFLLYQTGGNTFQIGNIDGFAGLADTASFDEFLLSSDPLTGAKDTDLIQYFDVDPIRPEKVQTLEAGFRLSIDNRWYIDAGGYYSRYRDFIGYNTGLTFAFRDTTSGSIFPSSINIYRLSANATDIVTTVGAAVGIDYFIDGGYTVGGNYSWNRLTSAADDPILPAFNTPEHKFNLRFSGRDVTWFGIEHVGFAINYKWIDTYFFEGSPSFTGTVPSYGMVDVQLNKRFPDFNTTFKLGASNILNNQVFTLYGGPRIGRLAYFSVTTDIWKPKVK